MKTDLQKILSVSGESGLFQYLSQGKNGIIAESIVTKKRTAFSASAKVTSLSDVSIYTDETEESLRDLFIKMKGHLAGAVALDPKSDSKMLVRFFEEVLPNYDREKFYTSHMKKVLQWYNILSEHASLDFVDHEQEAADAQDVKGDSKEKAAPKAKATANKTAAKAKAAAKTAMPKAAPRKVASVAKKGA